MILEQAGKRTALFVVNNPKSTRLQWKLFLPPNFHNCLSSGIGYRRAICWKAFHKEHGDVSLKPLDGMGGTSIFRIKPARYQMLSVIIGNI